MVGLCLCLSVNMVLPALSSAAEKNLLIGAQDYMRRVADNTDHVDTTDGMQQTLNLNFSPEERMRLRKALDTYARTVDPSHDQIAERRRAMQKSIESRFLAADRDNNNSLDRQEATESLPQVARHFNQVDANQDGFITIDELLAFQNRIEERKKATEAIAAGQENIKDLTPKELADLIKRKGKQASNNSRKSEPL
jgi:Ca2+-binding EF-hand superfamily protein